MKTLQKEAKTYLKTIIKPTTKIFVVQNSVSSSGMSRRLDLYVYNQKSNSLQCITGYAGDLMEWSYNNKGLLVKGCGMDMHFHTVDVLTSYPFPRGSKNFKGNGGSCLDWQSL